MNCKQCGIELELGQPTNRAICYRCEDQNEYDLKHIHWTLTWKFWAVEGGFVTVAIVLVASYFLWLVKL